MFYRVMRAERYKMLHSPVWLAFLVLPMFPAFFGSVNLMNNLGLLSLDWNHLWTQHSLFSSYFFYPALVGVYCSYLWRLEHFDHNWNQVLCAPVPVSQIVLGKLTLAAAMTFLAQAWGMVLFVVGGLICGIPISTFPLDALSWLVCGVWRHCGQRVPAAGIAGYPFVRRAGRHRDGGRRPGAGHCRQGVRLFLALFAAQRGHVGKRQ